MSFLFWSPKFFPKIFFPLNKQIFSTNLPGPTIGNRRFPAETVAAGRCAGRLGSGSIGQGAHRHRQLEQCRGRRRCPAGAAFPGDVRSWLVLLGSPRLKKMWGKLVEVSRKLRKNLGKCWLTKTYNRKLDETGGSGDLEIGGACQHTQQ